MKKPPSILQYRLGRLTSSNYNGTEDFKGVFMKFYSILATLLLSFVLVSCQKENHTGFQKNDYSIQKREELTIHYDENDQGVSEEKKLDHNDLVVKKTMYSEDFQQKTTAHKLNLLKESTNEITSNQITFTHHLQDSPIVIYPIKLKNSQVIKSQIDFQFDQQINYNADIAPCDEIQKIEQNLDKIIARENLLTLQTTEELPIKEVQTASDGQQHFNVKKSQILCLKIPKISYFFYLKKLNQSDAKEDLLKLQELIASAKWESYGENIPAWQLAYLGKYAEDSQHGISFSYTLYQYYPISLKINQQFSFSWQKTLITIDSRQLDSLHKEQNLPLEFKESRVFIPHSVPVSSSVHHPKLVMIPNEPCITFVASPHRGRSCEKNPVKYQDMGFDLITTTDRIDYGTTPMHFEKTEHLLKSLLNHFPEEDAYFVKENISSIHIDQTLVKRINKTEKRHYNGAIENVQDSSYEENIKQIYQLDFYRHFDQWKKTNDTIELGSLDS